METRKIKKLVINQEVVSNLNEGAMQKIKGGSGDICGTFYFNTCRTGWCDCFTLNQSCPVCVISIDVMDTCHASNCRNTCGSCYDNSCFDCY